MSSKILASPPYGNFKVLNLEGQLMFRCGPDKAEWYLERNLAKSLTPDTIQLTFVTNGPGHIGDKYFLVEKNNMCVVCASKEALTMHHVVPRCYRKNFPDEIKSHSSHDVVVLCIDCHELYEQHAFTLKEIIAKEYEVPVSGRGVRVDERLRRVRRAAGTLTNYRSQLPESRIEELYEILRDYCDKDHITEDDIISCANIDPKLTDGFVHHGKCVIEQTKDLEGFVKRWRKHFVDTMNPQHLPEGWDLERTIYRGARDDNSYPDS